MANARNYILGGVSPVDQLFSGIGEGLAVREQGQRAQLAEEANMRAMEASARAAESHAMQMQQEQAQAQRQGEFRAAMGGLAAMGPAATVEDYQGVLMQFPEYGEAVLENMSTMSEIRQLGITNRLSQVGMALQNGAVDTANELMAEYVDAARNSGDEAAAVSGEIIMQSMQSGPDAGLAAIGTALTIIDPEQAATVFGTREAQEMPAAVQELEWRAEQAGLVPGSEEYRTFILNNGQMPQGQTFRPATKEEAAEYGAAAGQFGPDNRFYPINPPPGMSVEYTEGGGFRIVQGAGMGGQSATGEATVGQAYNPGEVQSTLDLISEIKNDPALPRVTGPIQGGGGNDVGEFGVAKRAYYGDEGLSVIQKINQLQSRAWLAARDMLKGGGPITDYESRKAEAAVARLERAQGDAEFVAALTDLEEAITEGLAKLDAANADEPQASDNNTAADEAFMREHIRRLNAGEPVSDSDRKRAADIALSYGGN